MKNIHTLPTDKPSRYALKSNGKFVLSNYLYPNSPNFTNYHIYITSDEEINKDTNTCWCIDISCDKLVLHQEVLPSYHYKHYKKIIMTTDKSINVLCSCGKNCGAKESGVQAIDDEFLEWFVKNPSCEFINIEELYFHGSGYYKASELSEQEKEKYSFMKTYKIIIPKEEEPKLETLEEASVRAVKSGLFKDETLFIAGAKWKQKQMYSEEEAIKKIIDYVDFQFNTNGELNSEIKKWFEQFSKLKKGNGHSLETI